MCRWGGIEESVTALEWLATQYSIQHICILAYNSKANGVVEYLHQTICNSLVKACNGNITQWPTLAHHIFWADRVTT